ncbi:hypothetical protein STEG23_016822 [Scotinomys teguina]
MAILPKAIYRFNAIPIKIPTQFFIDLKRAILNFIWRNKKPRIAKSSLYNKAISGGITIPDFKLYYRATVLKTAWYWHQNRHVDQWNRIEDPDINPHRYENPIFDKDAKTVKWKKESIFNKWCWHSWMATCRRLQIDPYLSPCTKLKSKCIKDLNINPGTLNLIEEKVGSTFERIGTGDHFLNITPTAQTLSATINQWNYMKLRSFCKAKDTVTKTKHQPIEWEKIFTNPTSDRGLISRIYKELKKHDIKTPNSPIEKWAIELNREFTAEEYQMVERHVAATPVAQSPSRRIPAFFFPLGQTQAVVDVDAAIAFVERVFLIFPHDREEQEDLGLVAKVVVVWGHLLTRSCPFDTLCPT